MKFDSIMEQFGKKPMAVSMYEKKKKDGL